MGFWNEIEDILYVVNDLEILRMWIDEEDSRSVMTGVFFLIVICVRYEFC